VFIIKAIDEKVGFRCQCERVAEIIGGFVLPPGPRPAPPHHAAVHGRGRDPNEGPAGGRQGHQLGAGAFSDDAPPHNFRHRWVCRNLQSLLGRMSKYIKFSQKSDFYTIVEFILEYLNKVLLQMHLLFQVYHKKMFKSGICGCGFSEIKL